MCKRGHVQQYQLTAAPSPEQLGFCPECGAGVLGRCPECAIRIRGDLYIPGVHVAEDDFEPARFCDGCGAPYPWATRQDRIFELENLLDEEDIDDATRLLVREDLERLRTQGQDLDQDAELKLWRRVKDRAPGLVVGAGSALAQSLLSAYLQQKLGL